MNYQKIDEDQCIIHLSTDMTNYLEKINSKEERFIFAHSLRGFIPIVT
jgi:hypothetical protein